MDSLLEIIKGVHPGKFIEMELNKKNLTQRLLAEQANIPYQTINAIIAGRRNLTTEQSLRLDKALGYEEGFFALLQTHYDIKECKDKELKSIYLEAPALPRALFWDVDFDKINWAKHKEAVIERVLERGGEKDIEVIKNFYGISDLKKYLNTQRFNQKRYKNRKEWLSSII